jgi:hypothetical protein
MSALHVAGILVALAAGGIVGASLLPRSSTAPSAFPTASPVPPETMPPNGWVRSLRVGETEPFRYSASSAIDLWTDCPQNHVADVVIGGTVSDGSEAGVTGRHRGSCHLVAFALDGYRQDAVRAVLTVEVSR